MQSIVPLAFWLLLLGALSTGWRAGDRQDRIALVAIFAAAVLTFLAQTALGYVPALAAISMINLALLAVVYRYALASGRYWPIWFAGVHGAATLVGLLALVLPPGGRSIMAVSSAMLAGPALIAVVAGLLLDQRKGVANPER